MSLIGKLEEVNIGDIITLNTQGQLEVTGYVHKYSQKKVRLSTTNPHNNVSDTRFWAWIHI